MKEEDRLVKSDHANSNLKREIWTGGRDVHPRSR